MLRLFAVCGAVLAVWYLRHRTPPARPPRLVVFADRFEPVADPYLEALRSGRYN